MSPKAAAFLVCLMLTACAPSQPRIIQTSSNATEIRLATGVATQIELPEGATVQSITVGKPAMVEAASAGNIINLTVKEGAGETNIIVRATDEDNHAQTYQYRLVVQPQ